MTKLTKEQIEKEQSKFIEFYKAEYQKEYGNNGIENFLHVFRQSKKGVFVDIDVKKLFREWLAQAEISKEKTVSVGIDWALSPDYSVEISADKFNKVKVQGIEDYLTQKGDSLLFSQRKALNDYADTLRTK